MPDLGLLALPSYADLGRVFQFNNLPFSSAVGTSEQNFVVPGDYLYVLASVRAVFTLSAAAGSRVGLVEAEDSQGNVIWQSPATASTGPGSQYVFNWSAASASAYGPSAQYLTMPLPDFVLYPTQVLIVGVDNPQAGDVVNVVNVSGYKIATKTTDGPDSSTTAPTPIVATPVLV